MANAPIKKLRDYGLSTAIFEWNNDGKKSYSISLQRSYKKKDATEYTNESINLYPEDLLKLSRLLERTYDSYLALMQSDAPASAPAPQQTTQQATNSDDIPF